MAIKVDLQDAPIYHWRPIGSVPEAVPNTTKIRLNINVWGGISHKGNSDFCVRLIFLNRVIKVRENSNVF